MTTELYPTRRAVIRGFDESEDVRNASGTDSFEYCRKQGDLVDEFAVRRFSTHGIARAHANLPAPYRARASSCLIVLRSTPCRINGITVDDCMLLLIPPQVEFEGQQEAGTEYNVDCSWEDIRSTIRMRSQPGGVVGVTVGPGQGEQLRGLIRRGLEGENPEGGILAQALAPFGVGPEKLVTPARERLAHAVRDVIDARLESEVCLADVSRRLGVSIRSAERAFRIRFQETMVAYIKRARLTRARDLLTTGIPVTEAALEVGWTHLGRFSVEFKKRFGESPSVLRKRHQAAA